MNRQLLNFVGNATNIYILCIWIYVLKSSAQRKFDDFKNSCMQDICIFSIWLNDINSSKSKRLIIIQLDI